MWVHPHRCINSFLSHRGLSILEIKINNIKNIVSKFSKVVFQHVSLLFYIIIRTTTISPTYWYTQYVTHAHCTNPRITLNMNLFSCNICKNATPYIRSIEIMYITRKFQDSKCRAYNLFDLLDCAFLMWYLYHCDATMSQINAILFWIFASLFFFVVCTILSARNEVSAYSDTKKKGKEDKIKKN